MIKINKSKLQIYYQNSDIKEKETNRNHSKDIVNYISSELSQTDKFNPDILYKPISKIWTLNDE